MNGITRRRRDEDGRRRRLKFTAKRRTAHRGVNGITRRRRDEEGRMRRQKRTTGQRPVAHLITVAIAGSSWPRFVKRWSVLKHGVERVCVTAMPARLRWRIRKW